MAQEYANLIKAVASVTGGVAAGAAVATPFTWNSGFNAASAVSLHAATGSYVLVPDAPQAAAQAAVFVTQRGTTDCTFEVSVATNGSTVTVVAIVGGAASDTPGFDIMLVGAPNT